MAKHRFETEKQPHSGRALWGAVLLFALIGLLFCLALNAIAGQTAAREEETLRLALEREITHCYALEGSYPESLEYLKEHYGLRYDEQRFYVDYRSFGSNVLPDVTVIDREAGR